MGRYITNDDIYSYEVFGLTNEDVASTTVDVYIADAEDYIDGKLAKLYDVPFTSTGIPNLVKKAARDLTGCYIFEYLYQKGNRNTNKNMQYYCETSTKLIQDMYDDKIRLVASLTAGSTGVIEPNINASLKATYTDMPPIVNMDSQWNWKTPGSLKDDISARRAAAQ